MYYLFIQIWIWLAIAFALGWIAHWFFCCRGKDEETSLDAALSASSKTSVENVIESPAEPVIQESWKPMGFSSAPDSVDDLKRIKGVGSVIEQTLNGLGIYQFAQIAEWTHDNVSWVENFLAFPGRIQREDWINQAQALGRGETTEFAKRVDKGDVDYD